MFEMLKHLQHVKLNVYLFYDNMVRAKILEYLRTSMMMRSQIFLHSRSRTQYTRTGN